jgi:hypothetical protein
MDNYKEKEKKENKEKLRLRSKTVIREVLTLNIRSKDT